MKWPATLTFIRHGESTYNAAKKLKRESQAYQEFRSRFDQEFARAKNVDWPSAELREMAESIWKEFRPVHGDYETPLTDEGHYQAEATGKQLESLIPVPDVIYVSPYLRTQQTLEGLKKGDKDLIRIKSIVEERIREQEYGLAVIYSDWRIYQTLNPAQALLLKLGSEYEYRFLNGESKADVRDRVRSFLTTVTREHADQNVLVVSHHLTLLSLRANLERWDREYFIQTDRTDAPINCGVTVYWGNPRQGKDGKLILDVYNKKLY